MILRHRFRRGTPLSRDRASRGGHWRKTVSALLPIASTFRPHSETSPSSRPNTHRLIEPRGLRDELQISVLRSHFLEPPPEYSWPVSSTPKKVPLSQRRR